LTATLIAPAGVGAHPEIGTGTIFGLPLAKGEF